MEKRNLHAIVFSWPRQGHISPLLRFSQLLAMEGCQVTFAHNELNLKRVMQAAAPQASDQCNSASEDGSKLRFVGIKDGLPKENPRDMESLILSCTTGAMQEGLASSFDSLVGSLLSSDGSANGSSGPCTTFIVSDMFMTFTQDVANKYGIPRIAIYTQSAASFVCHLVVSRGFRPLPGDKYLNCAPGVLPSTTQTRDMISFLQSYDPTDLLFKFMVQSFHRLSEPTCIVLNTFDELEHDAIDYIQNADTKANRFYCAGPLLPSDSMINLSKPHKSVGGSLREEDDKCLTWLDGQASASVLFVSFGSLATITARQAEEFALGLENSMVPFLWVLRPELIEDGGALPEGFLERVRGRAYFVTWAPQTRVLKHRSVGGFLTHCGWNSTLEAVAAGVPMLGWSYFADQMLHCRCIADGWGVGLSLFESDDGAEREEGVVVTRMQVEKKVRSLMLELPWSVKRNCARMKEAVGKAAERRKALLLSPLLEALRQGRTP